MEFLELLIIAPIAYLAIRLSIKEWNNMIDVAYNEAQVKASCLLGEGQRNEASQIMDKALSDYKRFTIRKVMGFKIK